MSHSQLMQLIGPAGLGGLGKAPAVRGLGHASGSLQRWLLLIESLSSDWLCLSTGLPREEPGANHWSRELDLALNFSAHRLGWVGCALRTFKKYSVYQIWTTRYLEPKCIHNVTGCTEMICYYHLSSCCSHPAIVVATPCLSLGFGVGCFCSLGRGRWAL